MPYNNHFEKHLILKNQSVIEALTLLDSLSEDAIIFVVDEDNKLLGSLTDGDVRRSLIKGKNVSQPVLDFVEPHPKFIRKGNYNLDEIVIYRDENYKIIPVVDEAGRVINIINFRLIRSYLPVDAIIMAGGRGERLRPLTDKVPKPLLPVGDKPIIEHNIDRLVQYGIDDIWISVRYLGQQLKDHFKNGKSKGVSIQYINEDEPLGTIGAASAAKDLKHDVVLVTNSDILTNLDYEDFYMSFRDSGADLSVITIPYDVSIPYAVLETSNGHVISFKEKPTYTYYSNGGIYLMKREVLELIPDNTHFNATDLMDEMIKNGKKIHSYPLRGYWLDIGKPEEYLKAQEDIKHLRL